MNQQERISKIGRNIFSHKAELQTDASRRDYELLSFVGKNVDRATNQYVANLYQITYLNKFFWKHSPTTSHQKDRISHILRQNYRGSIQRVLQAGPQADLDEQGRYKRFVIATTVWKISEYLQCLPSRNLDDREIKYILHDALHWNLLETGVADGNNLILQEDILSFAKRTNRTKLQTKQFKNMLQQFIEEQSEKPTRR